MIARSFLVHGDVQGVFFRDWTVQQGRDLGLTGWVRNRRDGDVEVYAVGDAQLLDQLFERLQQGSPASRVENVSIKKAQLESVEGFSRRQTV